MNLSANIHTISNAILTPLSYLYGAGVYVRNKFFDWKILKSEEFTVPVISVGNIAVGGTGKTPHTEYIISILRQSYNIGIVSRGYKRHTSGYVLATPHSSPSDIGDEPFQIYHKFQGSIHVAVCEKRVAGVRQLLSDHPEINLIILDDAFQHRYIKPALSIVLTEYNRPFFTDRLLPLGRLRESHQSVRNRADFVVVTKCPDEIKPLDLNLLKKNLDLYPFQKIFFSKFNYGALTPVFPDESRYIPMLDVLSGKDTILMITGIANPLPLVKYLKSFDAVVKVMQYPDHHSFSRSDLDDISRTFASLHGRYKFIMTTEKDAVRMASNPYFPNELKQHVFYQPIAVEFMPLGKDDFEIELRNEIKEKQQKVNINQK